MIENNAWIQTNTKYIEKIKRICLEHDMKGGYGGAVPLNNIIQFFDSATIEIKRLQREVDKLNSKNKEITELNLKNVETITKLVT